MFPTAPATTYAQRPPISGGPLVPHPVGSSSYAGAPPRYTHSPYTPNQPLLVVHSQPAYPAYYIREPRYGLTQPTDHPHHCRWCNPLINGTWNWPTCTAMWQAWTAAPNPYAPPGAAQQAPQARRDPVADMVGGTAPAP